MDVDFDIEILIASVFKRRAIWDKRDKLHSNRNIIGKQWKEISKEMALDENLLRKKWKYLRDQFSVELGKIPPARSGDAARTYTTRWPYFHLLYFLKDTVKARNPTGNCSANRGIDNTESQSEVDAHNETVEEDNLNNEVTQKDNEIQVIGIISGDSSTQSTELTVNKRKRSQTAAWNEAMVNIERQKLQFLKEKSERSRVKDMDDDDYHFFVSLLPHVRKIPLTKKLAFRGRVQELVDEYAYQQNTCVPQFSPQSFSSSSYSAPTSPAVPNLNYSSFPHTENKFKEDYVIL